MREARREGFLPVLGLESPLPDATVLEATGGDCEGEEDEESKLAPRACPANALGGAPFPTPLSLRRREAKRFTFSPNLLPFSEEETGPARFNVDPAFVTVGRASAVEGEYVTLGRGFRDKGDDTDGEERVEEGAVLWEVVLNPEPELGVEVEADETGDARVGSVGWVVRPTTAGEEFGRVAVGSAAGGMTSGSTSSVLRGRSSCSSTPVPAVVAGSEVTVGSCVTDEIEASVECVVAAGPK